MSLQYPPLFFQLPIGSPFDTGFGFTPFYENPSFDTGTNIVALLDKEFPGQGFYFNEPSNVVCTFDPTRPWKQICTTKELNNFTPTPYLSVLPQVKPSMETPEPSHIGIVLAALIVILLLARLFRKESTLNHKIPSTHVPCQH